MHNKYLYYFQPFPGKVIKNCCIWPNVTHFPAKYGMRQNTSRKRIIILTRINRIYFESFTLSCSNIVRQRSMSSSSSSAVGQFVGGMVNISIVSAGSLHASRIAFLYGFSASIWYWLNTTEMGKSVSNVYKWNHVQCINAENCTSVWGKSHA